jgi:RNA polymerase sigma-70 factor (ECF subfamily)
MDPCFRDGASSDEAQLMARIARGSAADFDRLYIRFSGPLLRLACDILRCRAAAEDVRQEVFHEIWKRAGEYRASLGTPFSWIMTVTRHKAIDRLRSEVRQLRHVAEYEAELDPGERSEESAADRRVMAAEAGTAVRGALEALTPAEREAVELSYFEGLSAHEISRRLQLPLGTVRGRVRRALRRLRRRLAHWR